MSITKEQQQALDDALVPREQRLRIGNWNYRLSTTFKPKEPTFQVALDVLSLTPFYQAFLISTSVPTIYMHESWATICPNLPSQKFVDPLFEEEILSFIRTLGHSRDIKSLSDVKVDTLHQPWRTFGTIINKCLNGKVTGLDQLRISRAQIIWDDPILTTMRFIPKHETVQKYGAILPDTLTNQAMKESDAYKTYYDSYWKGKRLKAIAKVTKSGKKKLPAQGLETLLEIALSEADQMKLITKRSKTQFYGSHTSGSGANEGTGVSPGVLDVPTYGFEDEQISWKSRDEDDDDEVSMSKDDDDNADNEDDDDQDDDNEQTESDNDGDDFVHPKFSTHDEEDKEQECSNLRVHTPFYFESTDDETYDEVTQGDNVEEEKLDEEKTNKEEEVNKMYNDVNINLKGRDTEMTDALLANQSSSISSGFISKMLNPNPDIGIDSILNPNIESTSLVDVPVTTNDEIPPSSVTTLPSPPIPLIQHLQQTPVSTPTIVPISSIPGIVDKYFDNQMNEAVKVVIQLQSDRLRDEAKAENEDFINTIDANIKKIIREQIKVQVKEQVSKILPRIEKLVNEQLEAEVLIRSSNEAKTSHVVAANLSELELKKILIDKMENNKSINRSVQQKTLYKALVDAYETDKDILATYGDTVTLKRRRDDKDEDDEPSAGSNRGSKEGSKSHQKSTDKFAQAEEPTYTVKDLEEPIHQEFNTGYTEDQPVNETTQFPYCNLARKEDPRESFNKLMDTPLDFSAFVLIRLKIEDLVPNTMSSQLSIVYDKHALWGISHWGRKRQQFYGFTLNRESARDVYSRHRILDVTKLKNIEWHNYKHLDWIIVRRNEDKLYTFKEGDYNRLRLQDIEDILLLLVQGKLTNLNVEERLALGVSLRMFTRSIILRRRVEDL
ncbi:hypothetical protein Tco_1294156 [Tanacetum coccineum]